MLLAADLSLTCSGACVFDLEKFRPLALFQVADYDPGPTKHLHERARTVAKSIVDRLPPGLPVIAIAFEGPAYSARFRTEETTAIRQAFFDVANLPTFLVIAPGEAKRALSGNGQAGKEQMVRAALVMTRGTPMSAVLSAQFREDRKTNPKAEAMADALGVAIAAAGKLKARVVLGSSVGPERGSGSTAPQHRPRRNVGG